MTWSQEAAERLRAHSRSSEVLVTHSTSPYFNVVMTSQILGS